MDKKRRGASLGVYQSTRIQANHISAATDKNIQDLAQEAFQLLQDHYGLPPPLLKQEADPPVRDGQ